MNAPTETTRMPDLRTVGGTVVRTLDAAARRLVALDLALLGTVLFVALAAGYVGVAMPAPLVLVLGGFAAAVALATALPFAVVRVVGATVARAE